MDECFCFVLVGGVHDALQTTSGNGEKKKDEWRNYITAAISR